MPASLTQIPNDPIRWAGDEAISRLLDLAKDDGRNHRVLAEMLWEIQAEPQLSGLIHIARRIREILHLQADDGAFRDQHPALAIWEPLLDWLLADPQALANRLFADGQEELRSGFLATAGRNPVLGRNAQEHRLYCLLWDRGPSEWTKDISTKFLILQAQMLAAHAAILHHERHTIERGGEPREKLQDRLYSPAVCCWRFERKREPWRSAVARFPCVVHTSQYIGKLWEAFGLHSEEVEVASTDTTLETRDTYESVVATVKRILWFLRWGASPDTFRLVTFDRQSADRESEVATIEASGVRDDPPTDDDCTDHPSQFVVHLSDPDDDGASVGKLHVQATGDRSSPEKRALLDAGEYPHEPGPDNTVEFADNELIAGITRAGAPEKANQLLPWSWDTLSMIEIARALNSLASVDDPEISENGLLELRALAECMLWTGLSLKQCLSMAVYSSGTTPPDAELSICIHFNRSNSSTSAAWRVQALTPEYHSTMDSPPGDRERVDFLEFADFCGAHAIILDVLRSASGTQQEPLPISATRLFQRDSDWYEHQLKSLLYRIDETGRVTPGRLSAALFQRIIECSAGDIAAAAIITRTEHYLASARLFYATPSVDRLIALHQTAVQSIIRELNQAGWRRTTDLPPTSSTVRYSVGSRLCPSIDATRQAVDLLKRKMLRQVQLVDEDHTRAEIVLRHNWYSIYSVWAQMFCVGTRGILNPYVHLGEFDEATRLSTIADKDSGNDYKRRLIWVPETVWEQMQYYAHYLDRMHARYDLPKPSRNLPCYFLRVSRSGKFQPVRVRPRTMQQVIGNQFPFPANFPRRFVRTEFLEQGLHASGSVHGTFAPEFADCWMSHHFRGEEPWGPYSSFSYSGYFQELGARLEALLAQLGFEPIPMELIA